MISIRTSYKKYKEISEEPVPMKLYLKIVYGFMKYAMRLVFEGNEIKLPLGMGSIFVQGKKQEPKMTEAGIRGLAPDWVGTRKLWNSNPEAKAAKKILYHFNEHTNGIRYRISWSKRNVLVRHKRLYSLIFTRTNKRELVSLIKSGKEYHIKT